MWAAWDKAHMKDYQTHKTAVSVVYFNDFWLCIQMIT